MKTSNFLLAAALFCAVTGCDGSIGYEYRQERSDKSYQRGMDEYRAGRIDDAVKYLSEAVKSAPGNASARFQLAVILQESKKDYLGALCNFTEYMRIAENSDKAHIARDRMVICEKLLLNSLAADNGIGVDKASLKELESVRETLVKTEKLLAELKAAHEQDAKRVKTLERENAKLSGMLKRLGDTQDEPANLRPERVVVRHSEQSQEESLTPSGSRQNPAKTAVSDENEKPITLNPEAKALFEEEEREIENSSSNILPPASRVKQSADVKRGSSSPAGFYKTPGVAVKPEFYTVEHGDTLMKIAKKFYGDRTAWRKIREANKSVVPISGSVKAGDRLRLP